MSNETWQQQRARERYWDKRAKAVVAMKLQVGDLVETDFPNEKINRSEFTISDIQPRFGGLPDIVCGGAPAYSGLDASWITRVVKRVDEVRNRISERDAKKAFNDLSPFWKGQLAAGGLTEKSLRQITKIFPPKHKKTSNPKPKKGSTRK